MDSSYTNPEELKMSMLDLHEEITRMIEEKLENEYTLVTAEQLGLDRRAGYNLYISEHEIVVANCHLGSLNYYGGFEYINKDYILALGDYTVFTDDDSRVMEALEYYHEHQE